MVTKAITQSDLNNLEIRVKSEIRKDNLDERHNLDNKLGTYFFKVDTLEKSSAVNDNILKTMNTTLAKIDTSLDDINKKLEIFNDKFATKDDHKENTHKIGDLEKVVANINTKIVFATGIFSAIIFLIEHYGSK